MIYWCNTAKVSNINTSAVEQNRLLRLVEFTALNFMLRKLAQADFKDSKLSISSNLRCDRC